MRPEIGSKIMLLARFKAFTIVNDDISYRNRNLRWMGADASDRLRNSFTDFRPRVL